MVLGVIPARYASTRFPGKLLADLNGRPVLQWTWERALGARSLDRLVIAAGDERIAEAARGFGAEVIEVFEGCTSGSDRVWLASKQIEREDNSSFILHPSSLIVNIQGDEPLLDPSVVDAVVDRLLADPDAGMATAVTPIGTEAEYRDHSVVKVVLDKTGKALYFSRAQIPFGLKNSSFILHPSSFRHIGIYAYRRDVLRDFTVWPSCELEKAERLEQLRLLHNGVKVVAAVVEEAGMAVDTEGDLERVRNNVK